MTKRSLALALVSSTLSLGLFGSVTAGASSSHSWPNVVRAHVFYLGNNPKPIAFDTLIDPKAFSSKPDDITSRSVSGNVQWALGSINSYQYPIVSSDQGSSWRVGGTYFGGPWADACSFVEHLRAVRANVVVGWGGCPGTLYVTWDSGRHWNGVPMPGGLESLTISKSALSANVSPFASTLAHPIVLRYVSRNSGRTWLLTARK
jgi:hypothetical protein